MEVLKIVPKGILAEACNAILFATIPCSIGELPACMPVCVWGAACLHACVLQPKATQEATYTCMHAIGCMLQGALITINPALVGCVCGA